jgi:hypothetical protein
MALIRPQVPAFSWDFGAVPALPPNATFTRATTASYVNSAGTLSSAASGAARYDYDPATLRPRGILLEGAVTNLAKQSGDFTNATWTRQNLTSVGSAITAPDGTTTFNLAVPNTTSTTFHNLVQTGITCVVSSIYTFSVYAKASGTQYLVMTVDTGTNSGFFDLTNGTIAATDSTVNAVIVAIGGGVYRCSITFTADTTSKQIQLYFFNGTVTGPAMAPTYAGDGVSGIYLWGAQTELGGFATSYIPTTTVTVARNADVLTVGASSWLNRNAGTMVARLSTTSTARSTGTPGIARLDDGSAANAVSLLITGTATPDAVTAANAKASSAGTLGGANLGNVSTVEKAAVVSYADTAFAAAYGGAAPLTSTDPVPTGLSTLTLGSSADSVWVRSVAVYGKRTTAARVQQASGS